MRPRRIGDALAPAILLLVAGLVATMTGCERDRIDRGSNPRGSALDLFALARIQEPSDDLLNATFAHVPGPGAERAALLDALDGLADATDAEIVAIDRSAGPRDAFVDVAVKLPGGGNARVSVRVEAGEEGFWRVRWFQGPGVEWPAGRAGRDEGLTTSSAPPESER